MFLHKTDDWRICDYKDKILLKRFAADNLFFLNAHFSSYYY